MRRMLYQPRHRSQTVNGAVTGIVKPSRYTQSSGGNSSAATPSPKSNNPKLKWNASQRKQQRRRSLPSAPKSLRQTQISGSLSQLKPSEIRRLSNILDPLPSDDDDDDEGADLVAPVMKGRASDFSDEILNISAHSNQSWVANGVDFSTSMEVFLFEK
mmetsp:Transcript_9840/g.21311  ORF Transcript_9840/g.21311 Transcript_9840/m.21311 type:complete len:158 (+) Transcript_9840:331-804(+)